MNLKIKNTASRYGLEGPGIEPQWGRVFPHPSRPAVGPTQHSVKWVVTIFPGVRVTVAWC
jgi:hypothetical protein